MVVTITEKQGLFSAKLRNEERKVVKLTHRNLYQLIALVVERQPDAEFNREAYQKIANSLRPVRQHCHQETA